MRRWFLAALCAAQTPFPAPQEVAHFDQLVTRLAATEATVVVLTSDIEVSATVHISGVAHVSSASDNRKALDGHDTVQVLSVRDGALRLTHLVVSRGATYSNGAGLAADSSSVEAVDCDFTGNRAARGAAVYLLRSRLTATDCVFSGNVVDDRGGALYALLDSTAVFFGSSFTRNEARRGGAVYAYQSEVACTDVSFEHNKARDKGGACMADHGASLNLTRSSFADNTAWIGETIHLFDTSTALALESHGLDTFADNIVCTSSRAGGVDSRADCVARQHVTFPDAA